MSPSRSRRSSSRRSSILKPAKPRQALQNLNVHSSSNENSPATTSKFKRRVSFAEKKHVKEFCNSVEQGTVWDTTYEEHDLSHLKVPGTVNQEEHDVQIIQKENIVNYNQEINMQLVCKERVEKDLVVKGSDISSTITVDGTENGDFLLSQAQMLINPLSVKFHNVPTQNNKFLENDNHEFEVVALYDKSSGFSQHNSNPNNLNATFIQDVHMELTELVCHTVNHDTDYIQNSKVEETLDKSSMELTKPIFSTIDMLQNFQQKQTVEKFHSQYKLNKSNVTVFDQNTSMDLTVAVPSISKATANVGEANSSIYCVDNRTKRFDNMSMEMTTPIPPVPSILHNFQQSTVNNKIETSDLDFTTCVSNKTTVFHDASMEITNVIKTKADKDTNYQTDNEKTKLLNTSMEFTVAMLNNVHSIAESQERIEKSCDIREVSVENNLEKIRSDVDYYKTLINFDNSKVYDTETITTPSRTNVTDNVQDIVCKEHDVQTVQKENIQNNSFSQCNNDIKDDSINLVTDKTVSQNSSMVITKVISPSCLKHNCKETTDTYESNKNNPELCSNMSMEITEAAIACTDCINCTNTSQNVLKDNYKETTKAYESNKNNPELCSNMSMEITEAAIACTDCINCTNTSQNVSKDNYKETTKAYESNKNNQELCSNMSMEITEAAIAPQCHVALNNPVINATYVKESVLAEAHENKSTDSINCTNTSQNVSKDNYKETTEAYESNKNNQELCSNMSMEITEAAIAPQCHVALNNPVANATYVKESVLAEAHENKSTDSTNCTNLVVPSSSRLDLILGKEMQVGDDLPQFLKEDATKTPVTEIENSVNSSSDTMLKENIKEKTYVLHSPLLNNPPNVTTSEISQNECLSHKQNVIPNSRRTYVIHPLTIDHSCNQKDINPNNNNEINNDTSCNTSNDKINCTNTSLNGIDMLQNNDKECWSEKDALFFNNTLEALHTITPPSFVLLDDSSNSDIPVDNLDNNKVPEATEQKNILETKCNLEDVTSAHEETLKMDQVADVQMDKANEECTNVDLRPDLESHDCSEQKDASIELDPFSSLMNTLKVTAQSDKIIWEVYHENIERNLFVIGFISCSLLAVIYLNDHCDVKEIKIHSRLADDADALISIVHRITIEKLDAQVLKDLCKSHQDVFSILDYISKEVKLAMDFMFDVERISDVNLMEVTCDSISFVAFAKRKDIILRVTVAIKPFQKIESDDISVHCTLGSVSEESVKRLITNIKRDHKFLRRYINDVNDYIYLMEESANLIKR